MNSEYNILGLTIVWSLVSLGIGFESIRTYAVPASLALMISIFIYLWVDIISMSRRSFVKEGVV